jgi:hypothetical protein
LQFAADGFKFLTIHYKLKTTNFKHKKAVAKATAFLTGDPSEIRTRDTLIKSQVLYQLS